MISRMSFFWAMVVIFLVGLSLMIIDLIKHTPLLELIGLIGIFSGVVGIILMLIFLPRWSNVSSSDTKYR